MGVVLEGRTEAYLIRTWLPGLPLGAIEMERKLTRSSPPGILQTLENSSCVPPLHHTLSRAKSIRGVLLRGL